MTIVRSRINEDTLASRRLFELLTRKSGKRITRDLRQAVIEIGHQSGELRTAHDRAERHVSTLSRPVN